MLTEVCDYIHNYFEIAVDNGEHTIAGGTILAGSLLEGQRFMIAGSALNDGIYTYHADGIKNDDDTDAAELKDETFTGSVIAMGVPVAVLKIVADIAAWADQYGETLAKPYTSESFDGYSYTKATGSGSNAGGALTWQDVFRSRLKAYRKIA